MTPDQEQSSGEAALQLHILLRSLPAVYLAASMQHSSKITRLHVSDWSTGDQRLPEELDAESEAADRQLKEQQLYDSR